MTSPVYVAPSLSDILPSVVFPQNLPSVICSHVLDPQPNNRVLDMCAAPGGKTTHIATLMRDQGLVIAFDKGQGRVERIQSNASKWNLKSVRAFPYDATKSCAIDADGDPFPPFPPEYFDRVLLDAPCSGLGQKPSVFNKMSARELSSYPPLQRKLLAQVMVEK
ncbi:putative methyltransferase NSUN6 [Lingula anatina]|uniref:Methyltransferase NSUN6 n=1 Tax=Lingula anatina TaxID=7574 RepID=A0A2R2MJ15_LINAN|nr:putative methyltransferase NSUN6 [Lingula anatina]|eukprot:XP_023930216.1 putative methyltransferase NSUN6 [Lingula anatina]